LLPGYPGLLLLFHIAAVFAEGDEREVKGALAAFAPLSISVSHGHHGQVGRALPTATVDNLSGGAAGSNSIFFLLLNQEDWANGLVSTNLVDVTQGDVHAIHPG